MPQRPSRRLFLRTATLAGASFGLGEWCALGPLSPATADEAKVTPDLIRFSPDIEPVVRLIEKTPRDQCVAMMIEQLRGGLPYRNFLAALYLAHLRIGFVHHSLGALHSANELVLDLPVQERLLPAFWALDNYKSQNLAPGSSDMAPGLKPLPSKLPSPEEAEREFHAAMNAFDGERAERAIAVLLRTRGLSRALEPLWHFGARDWSFIGHIAIWVANTARILRTVGPQHAESALRVIVRTIPHEGLPGEQDKETVLKRQPYPANVQRVEKLSPNLPANWAADGSNASLTNGLLALIRQQKADDACDLAVSQLSTGKATAGAIWDAVHLAAGEMVLCVQKNSEPLHANTVANALHHAFHSSIEQKNRLLITLQAVGWMCLFRKNIAGKGWLKDARNITELEGSKIPDDPAAVAASILTGASYGPSGKPTAEPVPGWHGTDYNNQPWRYAAATRAFTYAQKFSASGVLLREAARLLPLKADDDPHRMKFPIAATENIGWVSPQWRPHLLAAASYSFLGTDALDTDLAKQAREAVRRL